MFSSGRCIGDQLIYFNQFFTLMNYMIDWLLLQRLQVKVFKSAVSFKGFLRQTAAKWPLIWVKRILVVYQFCKEGLTLKDHSVIFIFNRKF